MKWKNIDVLQLYIVSLTEHRIYLRLRTVADQISTYLNETYLSLSLNREPDATRGLLLHSLLRESIVVI